MVIRVRPKGRVGTGSWPVSVLVIPILQPGWPGPHCQPSMILWRWNKKMLCFSWVHFVNSPQTSVIGRYPGLGGGGAILTLSQWPSASNILTPWATGESLDFKLLCSTQPWGRGSVPSIIQFPFLYNISDIVLQKVLESSALFKKYLCCHYLEFINTNYLFLCKNSLGDWEPDMWNYANIDAVFRFAEGIFKCAVDSVIWIMILFTWTGMGNC